MWRPNHRMEPSHRTVCVIMSQRCAAHSETLGRTHRISRTIRASWTWIRKGAFPDGQRLETTNAMAVSV
jgi:hypothetical protein